MLGEIRSILGGIEADFKGFIVLTISRLVNG